MTKEKRPAGAPAHWKFHWKLAIGDWKFARALEVDHWCLEVRFRHWKLIIGGWRFALAHWKFVSAFGCLHSATAVKARKRDEPRSTIHGLAGARR